MGGSLDLECVDGSVSRGLSSAGGKTEDDNSSEDGYLHVAYLTNDHVLCITLRSPAGGFSEGERSSPSVLPFKGLKGDGFLKRRA